MNMRRAKPALRIQFLGLCMLLGLGALVLRLWWVQVARGYEWTARIQSSSRSDGAHSVVRGEIRDRNGVTLVQNRASYEVDFYLPEMVKGYRQRYGRPPETRYRATISGMPKDLKEPDIVRIVNDGVVPAARGSRPGARLQREPAAEALPQRHRGSLLLHQGHRFRDDGEIFRARCRVAGRGHRDQAGAFLCLRRARLALARLRRCA